jgi:hypothetical protein
LKRLIFAMCLILAAFSGAAFGNGHGITLAATPPATLTGETFSSSGGPGGASCIGGGTFSFTASGVATGPYTGTFTESGTGTLTDFPGSSQSFFTAFSATFTIYSPSGAVLVTGSKTLDTSVPNTSDACYNQLNAVIASGIPTTYGATIDTPAGNYHDQGTSAVGNLRSGPTPTDTTLAETFTSTSTQPTLIVPTGKDQCMNGGYQNYPQFMNQGQCVSFVASQGKSATG